MHESSDHRYHSKFIQPCLGHEFQSNLLDLHFIPLVKEKFDLIVLREYYQTRQVRSLLSFFEQGNLLPFPRNFVGFDITETRTVVRGSLPR